MTKIRYFFISSVFSILFSIPAYAMEIYKIDPMHSFVLWHISHFGFSIQSGKFTEVEGELKVDKANPQNSKVNVVIHTDKVFTGIAKLDKHLKEKDFFDVSKYPTATFVSDKVDVTSSNTGKVTGMLTLLGVTKPVTLNVTLLKQGLHPMTKKNSLGFTATTTIKRSDFGMKSHIPALGDDVKIDISAEATLINSDKTATTTNR